MKFAVLAITLVIVASTVADENVRLLDLEPPQAQQIIDSKDQTLKYAPKIESNVPAVRFIGNEPHQVQEDIYLANQYHGQDGLGGYLYGYSVPDIAKTEKKKAGGDLRGAYNYINGQGQEIKVEYWDDGTGFHQVDNVPKILPQQIDDTPEVKAAKEEHARLWKEQALRNSQPVEYPYVGNQFKPEIAAKIGAQVQTPGLPGYPQQQNQYQQGQQTQYQPQLHQYGQQQQQPQQQYQQSQYQQSQPQYQQQQYQHGGAYQKPGQQQALSENSLNNIEYTGEYSEAKESYVRSPQQLKKDEEEEDVTGPPRGFFYNFDYPVGIIVDKGKAVPVQKRESLAEVYNKNKEYLEKQLTQGSNKAGSSFSQYFVTS